jgi:hypothetical protein
MSGPDVPPDPSHDEPPRDPHLLAALRHAPDRDAAPPPALSAHILAQARQASSTVSQPLRPARTAGWLSSLWAWLAQPVAAGALGTVLIAGFIGLMWHGQPVPDAVPRPADTVAVATPAAAPDPAPANPPPAAAAARNGTAAATAETAAPRAGPSERRTASEKGRLDPTPATVTPTHRPDAAGAAAKQRQSRSAPPSASPPEPPPETSTARPHAVPHAVPPETSPAAVKDAPRPARPTTELATRPTATAPPAASPAAVSRASPAAMPAPAPAPETTPTQEPAAGGAADRSDAARPGRTMAPDRRAAPATESAAPAPAALAGRAAPAAPSPPGPDPIQSALAGLQAPEDAPWRTRLQELRHTTAGRWQALAQAQAPHGDGTAVRNAAGQFLGRFWPEGAQTVWQEPDGRLWRTVGAPGRR